MIIYESYNKTNGKVYVGLTTKTLEVRKASHLRSAKAGSKSAFHRAIRKYGNDSFEWYEVAKVNCVESLHKLERLFISLYETCQTYNCSLGGEHSAYGMKHTEETKKLCGHYAKKRWNRVRAKDKYPLWAFALPSYKEAAKFGIPKTTWYRHRKSDIV